jgi:uncharacterized protein YecE (DUF72 family)
MFRTESRPSAQKSLARTTAKGPSRSSDGAISERLAIGALRIGTSGWHYDSWRGPFYPPDLKPKDFLPFYVSRFATTELNNTFYRLPTTKALHAWRDSTPDDFLFAWKASRMITHLKRLKDVEENIAFVFERMNALGDKFGPVLFQLPPTLKADAERRERLARCLGQLPKGRRFTFEFRDPSWYEGSILDLLRDHDVALCFSDHEAAPAPWAVTASFIYIRAHGTDGRYAGNYGNVALAEWASLIARWRAQGRDVYVYFDNDVKSAAPMDAKRLLELTAEGPQS